MHCAKSKALSTVEVKQHINHLPYIMLLKVRSMDMKMWDYNKSSFMENSELTLLKNKISKKGEKPPHVILHNSNKEKKKNYRTYFPPLRCQMLSKDLSELFFVLFSLRKGRSRKIPINIKKKVCFPNAYFEQKRKISKGNFCNLNETTTHVQLTCKWFVQYLCY